MPQPKKRHSHSRQAKRRANYKLASPQYILCPNCKSPIRPHTMCPSCKTYSGRQILKVKEKKKKEKG